MRHDEYVVDVVNSFGACSYLGIDARAPREMVTGYIWLP